MTTFTGYIARETEKAYGVLVKGLRLLARAIFVVDADGGHLNKVEHHL